MESQREPARYPSRLSPKGSGSSEINDRMNEAGFSVTYEGIRRGKAFSHIRFTVTKTDGRQENDRTLSKKATVHKRRVRSDLGLVDLDNPPLPSVKGIEAFRSKWPGADPYEAIQRFQDKWRTEGFAIILKPDAAFLKFSEGMFKQRASLNKHAV